MRRLRVVIAAAALAAIGFAPAPSSAMVCHDSIDEVCRVAAQVICGVVNKGRPCLM